MTLGALSPHPPPRFRHLCKLPNVMLKTQFWQGSVHAVANILPIQCSITHVCMCMDSRLQYSINCGFHPNYVSRLPMMTGRCTPRPHSCSLTSVNTVPYQVIVCVATVGGCLAKCSSSVTDLANVWAGQSATCSPQLLKKKKDYIVYTILFKLE